MISPLVSLTNALPKMRVDLVVNGEGHSLLVPPQKTLLEMLREELHVQHVTLQVESVDHADDGACCVMDPRCLPQTS